MSIIREVYGSWSIHTFIDQNLLYLFSSTIDQNLLAKC